MEGIFQEFQTFLGALGTKDAEKNRKEDLLLKLRSGTNKNKNFHLPSLTGLFPAILVEILFSKVMQ